MTKEIDELYKYLVETINGKIKWNVSYNEEGEIESYNCYGVNEGTVILNLTIGKSNIDFLVYKVDGSRKRYLDGVFEYESEDEKDYIEYLKSQATKEEIDIVKALAKTVEVIIKLPELKENAKNGTWEDDEVSLEQMLQLIEGTIDGIFIWEEKECHNNVLSINHRLFKGYNFEIKNLRMFEATTFDDGNKYINTFYDFYKSTLYGLEHCCFLLIEDIENKYVYFREVTYIREFRQERALYTLSKVIIECDKLWLQRDDKRNLGYLLIQILEYAQSKGNILSIDEVCKLITGYDISAEELYILFKWLGKNNVDVLFENSAEESAGGINEDIKPIKRKRKYETETERLNARKASREKYRKKINVENEYSIKNTILAAEREQYEYIDEDIEDIMKIIEKQKRGNSKIIEDIY